MLNVLPGPLINYSVCVDWDLTALDLKEALRDHDVIGEETGPK